MAPAESAAPAQLAAPAPGDPAAPIEPAAKPATLPVDVKPDVLTSQGSGNKDPLQLCLPTYRDTFRASLISSIFILAGLIVLSISETGVPGIVKDRCFVLCCRAIAWIAWYFLPVHVVAVSNLRGFCVYGHEPANASLVCWRTALGPSETFEVAESMGFSRRRVVVGAVILPLVYLLIYVAFSTMYIGPEHEHCGFIFIYGVGHLVIIIFAEIFGPGCFPPPLSPRYSQKMGSATLGIAIMGYFVVTTAYSLGRLYVGPWLGVCMPAVLGVYEIGCLLVLERTFLREFVQEKPVRQAYRHSNQGILVSCQICLVHAMAEGGRMMLILADMSHSESDDYMFLVPIASSLAWNVVVRGGGFDWALSILSRGRRTPTRCSLLLQQAKYCMGYPRFLAIIAVAFARVCSGNSVLPEGSQNMGLAVLILFLSEVGEDIVSYVLERLHIRVLPRRRQITDKELEIMAVSQLRLSTLCEPQLELSIVPRPSPSAAWQPKDADNDLRSNPSLKEQCWKLRESFAFSYSEEDFETLPFWAHFAVVMVSQFHTVLFMILLGNGLNYTLGFCHEDYRGFGRALLWWPLTDREDLCS